MTQLFGYSILFPSWLSLTIFFVGWVGLSFLVSHLFDEHVRRWAEMTKTRLDKLLVGPLLVFLNVTYRSAPRRVEEILVEEATRATSEIEGLLGEPAPFGRFIPGFGESGLNFTLICQVREFVDQYYVQHELRHRIFERFNKEGVEIPFPKEPSICGKRDFEISVVS